MPERGFHDMGGEAGGPVDTHVHEPSLTERRIDAMMQLLRTKPRSYWVTDEMRRTIETLSPEQYNDYGYYARWAYSMRDLLVEKGVVTREELDDRLAAVKARLEKGEGADA